MKELNELVEMAERADSLCLLMQSVNPHHILAIAEAYRALEQREEAAEAAVKVANEHAEKFEREMYLMMDKVEAAEAKLAELNKQKPVGTVSISMDWNTHRNIATVNMRPDLVVAEMKDGDELFTRPAPAINLADLVPDEVTRGNEDVFDVGFSNGFNACRAAMLRNIEEQSQ